MAGDWLKAAFIFRAIHCPRFLDKRQSDVEKYIGGPDGDVESALRKVQDALAYVPLFDATNRLVV